MVTPALELLRRALPDVEFWFWGSDFNEELFCREPNYGGSLLHSRNRGWEAFFDQLSTIRGHQFDAAILFATQLRDVLISRLGGIPRVVGTIKKDTRLLLDGGVKYAWARHRASHFALLAEAAIPSGERVLPPVRLKPRNNDIVSAMPGPRIGLLLGGAHKGLRAYPPELAKRLLERLQQIGGHVFLLGDRQDAESAKRWLPESLPSGVHCLAGQTTVGGLADVIGSMNVMVTIDTGALHLAAALDVPFVSLVGFGTSAYCTVQPQGARGIHLMPASGVFRDQDWIQSLHPERVVAAIQMLLDHPRTLQADSYGLEMPSSQESRLVTTISGPVTHSRRDN